MFLYFEYPLLFLWFKEGDVNVLKLFGIHIPFVLQEFEYTHYDFGTCMLAAKV